jgi:signal transduction histidine kinase
MNKQMTVLYVEDDKIDQQAFVRTVRRGGLPYNYLVANTLSRAYEVLEASAVDIIVCDYRLTDGTALDLLQKNPDRPVIVITGGGDEATAVSVMKAGARDYITKSGSGDHLLQLVKAIANLMRVLNLEAVAREQHRFIQLMHNTVRVLGSTLDLDEVIALVLNNIQEAIPSDGANVMLITDDMAHVIRGKGCASDDTGAQGQVWFPIHDIDLFQAMHETRRACCVGDINPDQWQFLPPDCRARSLMAAPICVHDEVIGFLNLYSNQSGFFTPLHKERLQTYVDHVAAAIKNARLYQQAQDFAMIKERQRLGRDLHDSVTQTLFAASVVAKSVIRTWQQDPHAIKDDLLELRSLTSGALAEMRTLLFELHPRALYETELRDLLWQLSETAKGRAHINVIFEAEGTCRLPFSVHEAFFRIAQEGLNNVVKHARARQLHFILKCEDCGAELSIRDDGVGFDLAAVSSDHLGINIMRERAAEAGILLSIDSQVDAGTIVKLTWHERRNHD